MRFLGHVRVCETHGIRRFLYPVSLEIPAALPHTTIGTADRDCGPSASEVPPPVLIMPDVGPIPLQVTPGATNPDLYSRLDFAVSLSPFEQLELKLYAEQPESLSLSKGDELDPIEEVSTQKAVCLEDPLKVTEGKRFVSTQRRFSTVFDRRGTLHQAVYDSVPHLRAPAVFTRNGLQAELEGASAYAAGFPLTARVTAAGQYPDGCEAETHLETTACKSWVMLKHLLSTTQPGDELVFELPLVVYSSVVTCDFGVGGGIYGSLRQKICPTIVWHSEFLDSGGMRWSVASGDRTDYIGEVRTAEEYRQQLWFHQVDGHKALAVAITQIPRCCREMEITLRANGDVAVAFGIGEATGVPAAFGLCCHFLNDIPAISAATNPQSILLPPVVTWSGIIA